ATARPAGGSALAAAYQIFDAVPMADCQAGRAPANKQCVELRSDAATAERGIAEFLVGDSQLYAGFIGVLGRDAAGAWRRWVSGQNLLFQLRRLPGDGPVASGGHRLNLPCEP